MKIFWAFARQAFHTTAIYRFDFWMRLVNTFIWMYSSYWLWKVLYTQRPNAFQINLGQMVTYGVLAQVINIAIRPGNSLQYYIAHQVKSGAIEMDILKPMDFHLYLFARNFGEVLFTILTLGLPSFITGYLFLGLELPPDWQSAALFLLSLALGYLVLFSLAFLMGLLSLFTIDTRNISWAYNALVRFFSGQFVPIWLFPLILVKIADFLPFRGVFAIPLTIYIGKLPENEITAALVFQACWLIALFIAGRLLWRQAHARLVVQGG